MRMGFDDCWLKARLAPKISTAKVPKRTVYEALLRSLIADLRFIQYSDWWTVHPGSRPAPPGRPARSASGHAIAAPPRSVMNSRRFIRSPRLRVAEAVKALRDQAPWRSSD